LKYLAFMMLAFASLLKAENLSLSPSAQANGSLAIPAATPAAAASSAPLDPAEKAAQVERHFQEGRRLYLGSDREGALRELSQALALDPAHTGSVTLFETVKNEEKELRQVRLNNSETSSPAAEPAPSKAALSGFQKLWNYVKGVRSNSEKRDRQLEKRQDDLQDQVANLGLQVQAQQRGVDEVAQGQAKVEQKVRVLTGALFATLIGLLVALIVAARALSVARQRREAPSKLDLPTRGPRR